MLPTMERNLRKPRGYRIAGLLVVLLAAACQGPAFPDAWPFSAGDHPVRAAHGMVVSTDSIASQVGVDVLQAGGNAVDAAVAVQFALAVVNPEAGNIGGGGFLVLHWADGSSAALDFREKAPLAATRDMYLDASGEPTDASLVGHLASGVPGSVAGMWAAHRLYGELDWADLLEPAIRLAPRTAESLRQFPASAAQFLPRDGQPPQIGDTLRQPDLERTLRRIQELGPDGFYRGETADLIVAEMERGGGIITHEDLDAYEAVWRDPVSFTYRGHTVISMPPSSSGGATMAEIANILDRYDLTDVGWHSPESIHLYAEAFRRAYADRNYYLGDPDFVDQPLDRMISKAYADERASTIDRARATPSTEVEPGMGPVLHEGPNTTHYSIVDEDGDAVAVTTTLNALYGSKVTVTGAGFLLNDEMDDFSAKPGSPNLYGLVQGEQNAIEPGKRMLSSMSPAIVLDQDGSLRMVTGTPGGGTIITTVFQTISNVLDYGMNAAQAVNAPRVHHQHLPDRIQYEHGGLDAETVTELEALGHTVEERSGTSGDAQVIVVADSVLTGWSDPRGGGRAIGY